MKISDEAIEAAAMAILAVDPETWALQPTHVKDRYRWDAQAALQAALPYLDLDSQQEAEGPRWKVGDKAVHKSTNGVHIYLGAEEAERLGLKGGVDGWSIVEVVDGEPMVTGESEEPHGT